jgi:hypothetical protein
LAKNNLDDRIAKKLLGHCQYKDEYLDNSQKLLSKYKLSTEYSDLIYYKQKKDYQWLYDYFNEKKERKLNNIHIVTYGRVCFELNKYQETIEYYNEKSDKNNLYFIK